MHIQNISSHRTAFSLIELAIVLAILALGVGGGLTVLSSQDELNRIERTSDILDGLEEALKAFYAANGRLPCPAAKNLAVSAAGFGEEWDNGSGDFCGEGGTEPSNNTEIRRVHNTSVDDDEEIWIGTVPTRTLGLANRFAFDGWDTKITYAIPRALANPTDNLAYISHIDGRVVGVNNADIEKDIIIVDKEGEFSSGTTVTQANIADNRLNPFGQAIAYVLVSHGGDKAGGYLRNVATTPVPVEACNENTQDGLNCQPSLNGGVTDNEYATFRDQRVRDSDIEASFYYDYIRWKTLNNFRFEVDTRGSKSRIGTYTSITWDTDVVAPTDGFISLRASVSGPSPGWCGLRIDIDGAPIIAGSSATGASTGDTPTLFYPVRAGQTYRAYNTAGCTARDGTFVPLN